MNTMETLARADPWASMRVVDEEDDETNRASSPLMTRARRAATKRTVTTQKTRMGRVKTPPTTRTRTTKRRR